MKHVELDRPGPLLDQTYADVLSPSFPADELADLDGLAAGIGGDISVVVTIDDDGTPVACAVGEWSERSRTVLLGYLAVRSGQRSGGLGGRLLDHARQVWGERWQPDAILAEVENPRAHHPSEAYGDPSARLRFYARRGGRALDVPFFQPALRPGNERVYGILLVVLAMSEGAAGSAPDTVKPSMIENFFEEYLLVTEGAVGTDPATKAMLDPLRREAGIRLLPLEDPAALPCSTAAGPAS